MLSLGKDPDPFLLLFCLLTMSLQQVFLSPALLVLPFLPPPLSVLLFPSASSFLFAFALALLPPLFALVFFVLSPPPALLFPLFPSPSPLLFPLFVLGKLLLLCSESGLGSGPLELLLQGLQRVLGGIQRRLCRLLEALAQKSPGFSGNGALLLLPVGPDLKRRLENRGFAGGDGIGPAFLLGEGDGEVGLWILWIGIAVILLITAILRYTSPFIHYLPFEVPGKSDLVEPDLIPCRFLVGKRRRSGFFLAGSCGRGGRRGNFGVGLPCSALGRIGLGRSGDADLDDEVDAAPEMGLSGGIDQAQDRLFFFEAEVLGMMYRPCDQ